MDDATERYLAFISHERRLSPLTVKHYARDLLLLESLIGDGDKLAARAVLKLSETEIRRYAATLHSRGLAPRSLARVLSAWRGFFEIGRASCRERVLWVTGVQTCALPICNKSRP